MAAWCSVRAQGARGGAGDRTFGKEVWFFDFYAEVWTPLSLKPAAGAPSPSDSVVLIPPGRSNHCSWVLQNKLWLFGGEAEDPDEDLDATTGNSATGDYLRDMWTIDLTSGMCAEVLIRGAQPSLLAEASACVLSAPEKKRASKAAVLVFGGYKESVMGSQYSQASYRFLINSTQAKQLEAGRPELTCYVSHPKSLEPVPSRRADSTLTIDTKRKQAVLLFGYNTMEVGSRGLGCSNDVWSVSVSRKGLAVNVCEKCRTVSPGSTMHLCGACKKVRYCNSTCQKADWKKHKKICKANRDQQVNAASPQKD